ncbi:MAG: c-type cytochrome [Smithellaceae bacterium]|nr:c-type cytochrome [Smithellaceae bacterium]
MRKIFFTGLAIVACGLLWQGVIQASPKPSLGETAFNQHCSVCHAGGGNIINSAKPLTGKALAANGIKTPADIIKTMRNPGPGMTTFDKDTVNDKTANAIAQYILKAFK